MKIGVIGAGAWGTVVAQIFSDNGHDVVLWCYSDKIYQGLQDQQHHRLEGVLLSSNITPVRDFESCYDVDFCVLGFSSAQLLEYKDYIDWSKIRCPIGFIAKGIIEPHWFISVWLKEIVSNPIFVISGPNLAREIALKKPAAAVIACEDIKIAESVQSAMSLSYFRCYTSTDIIGVQCGGIFKNVLAIAAGCMDGLSLGNNAKSGLITRGIRELQKVALFFGALPETVMGLSGLGDLIATCTSPQSRNWNLGHSIAKSQSSKEWRHEMKGQIEGLRTVELIHEFMFKEGLDLPIISAVSQLVKDNISPLEIIQDLMKRGLKSETDSLA